MIVLIRAPYCQRWHVLRLDISTSRTRKADRFETSCGRYLRIGESVGIETLTETGGRWLCAECIDRANTRKDGRK